MTSNDLSSRIYPKWVSIPTVTTFRPSFNPSNISKSQILDHHPYLLNCRLFPNKMLFKHSEASSNLFLHLTMWDEPNQLLLLQDSRKSLAYFLSHKARLANNIRILEAFPQILHTLVVSLYSTTLIRSPCQLTLRPKLYIKLLQSTLLFLHIKFSPCYINKYTKASKLSPTPGTAPLRRLIPRQVN